MKPQQPLFDQTNASLPSPQFIPRPGWGGQLRRWLSENLSVLVFRIVVLCALILLGRALWIRLPARDSSLKPAVTSMPEIGQDLTLVANAGDGITTLAARAVDLYIATNDTAVRLDAAQHLFAVTTLATITGWRSLEVNEAVSFTTINILSVLDGAQQLTIRQKSAWAKFLRR